MAHPEHVEIVKQGTKAIRKWREKNPEVRLNLSDSDLSGANLSGADLIGAVLTDAKLSKANLIDADLTDAKLSKADLSGANLSWANLTGAVLTGAVLTGSKLDREDGLKDAARRGAIIRRLPVKEFWNAMAPVLFCILWAIFAYCLVYYGTRDPRDELALIRRADIARGFVVDSWEDVNYGDRGQSHWYHGATYKYQAADGREYTQITEGTGGLKDEFSDLSEPVPIDVEYLPDNPSVSRLKGAGCQSVFEWLWTNGLRLLLLAVFVVPSFPLFRQGFLDIKKLLVLYVGDFHRL